MSHESKYDLAVIGGGMAGLTAAARAGQLGLSACVLEKGSAERYLCNTRYTGGSLHVCLRDVMTDAAELRALIDTVTQNNAPAALADAIATDGRRLVRWLQGEGIRFMKASPMRTVEGSAAHRNWVLAPPRPARPPGLEWPGSGGDVLMRTLEGLIGKRGGKLTRSARARTLTMHDGRCVGVQAEVDGEVISFEAAAVVIADGGFQGNLALVGEYISPCPERLMQRGAGTGLGDGLLMAREAGAQITKLDSFYGHVLSCDAMSQDALWPFPTLDTVVTAAIAIDAHGNRFTNEGEGGVYVANAIARLADPLCAFAILDHAIWNEVGKRDWIPPNPHIPNGGGTVLQAQSIEALAATAGLPAATLTATVRGYNDAAKRGTTAQLSPRPAFRQVSSTPY